MHNTNDRIIVTAARDGQVSDVMVYSYPPKSFLHYVLKWSYRKIVWPFFSIMRKKVKQYFSDKNSVLWHFWSKVF